MSSLELSRYAPNTAGVKTPVEVYANIKSDDALFMEPHQNIDVPPDTLREKVTGWLVEMEQRIPNIWWQNRDKIRKLDPEGKVLPFESWESKSNSLQQEPKPSREQLISYFCHSVNPIGFEAIRYMLDVCARTPQIAGPATQLLQDYKSTEEANYQKVADMYALCQFYNTVQNSIWVAAASFPQHMAIWATLGNTAALKYGQAQVQLGSCMNDDLRFGCGNGAQVVEEFLRRYGYDQKGQIIHESRTWSDYVRAQYQYLIHRTSQQSLVTGNIAGIAATSLLDPSLALKVGIPLTLALKGNSIYEAGKKVYKKLRGNTYTAPVNLSVEFPRKAEKYFGGIEEGYRHLDNPEAIYHDGSELSGEITEMIEPDTFKVHTIPSIAGWGAYLAGGALTLVSPHNASAFLYGARLPGLVASGVQAGNVYGMNANSGNKSMHKLRYKNRMPINTAFHEIRKLDGSISDTELSEYHYSPSSSATEHSHILRNIKENGGITIPRGITVLSGPSGSGKSTFLKDFAKLAIQHRITDAIPGQEMLDYVNYKSFFMHEVLQSNTSPNHTSPFIAYLQKNFIQAYSRLLIPTATIPSFPKTILPILNKNSADIYEVLHNEWNIALSQTSHPLHAWISKYILEKTGVVLNTDIRGLPSNSLGEKKRLEIIAQIQNSNKGLYIFDETFSNLDPANVEKMVRLIHANLDRQSCTIIATHDSKVLTTLTNIAQTHIEDSSLTFTHLEFLQEPPYYSLSSIKSNTTS